MVPTIMSRSAWRGVKRGNSAPKRARSYRPHITLMYSIPQQAVTKGYWKSEFARAQPRAPDTFSSNQLVASSLRVRRTGTAASSPAPGCRRGDSGWLPSGRKMGSLPSANAVLLRPLERALAPHVDEAEGERSHEGEHLHVSEPAQSLCGEIAQQRSPRVDEDALDVEDDEEERDQVELHRMARVRVARGRRAALERRLLDGEDALRAEIAGEQADGEAHHPCQEEQDQDRQVGL